MLPDPFNNMAVPKELTIEFFAVFSRCEYAMKETNYRHNSFGRATADWLKLGNDAAGWLPAIADADLAAAIELLTATPPRIQTYADGWQPRPLRGNNAVSRAVDAATRVRNNLFHGGKNGRVEQEAGRDESLVRASLTLLTALIDMCPGDLYACYVNG